MMIRFVFAALLGAIGCTGSRATTNITPIDVNAAPVAKATSPVASADTPPAEPTANAAIDANDGDNAAPAAPTPATGCGLKATLAVAKGQSGDFILTLTNTSKRTLHLVEPGDGSSVGWRTPIVTWSASSGGKPAPAETAARCGLTNPMTTSEVFELAPGQSRKLTAWLDRPWVKPGTYDVAVRYRNDPKKVRNADAAVSALVATTDSCEVTSNTVKHTFRP